MNTHSFFSRLCRSPIPSLAAVILVTMALSSLAFCGEIHDADKSGDLEKVKALLKGNPDVVFSKDDDGRTPLHYAAEWGHKDVAELLLAHKADVNARNNYGTTPLHLAATNDHKDMAELLLANHAEVNAKDILKETPLHFAALKGHKDVVELLLANKADVNGKDYPGYTPLHLAALHGYKDVVELLLNNKADVNAKDNFGEEPLECAARDGHNDVAELLRQHGGHEWIPSIDAGSAIKKLLSAAAIVLGLIIAVAIYMTVTSRHARQGVGAEKAKSSVGEKSMDEAETHLKEAEASRQDSTSRFTVERVFHEAVEAAVAKAALDEAGIPYIAEDFQRNPYDGVLATQFGWGRILVREQDVERAKEIIEEVLKPCLLDDRENGPEGDDEAEPEAD